MVLRMPSLFVRLSLDLHGGGHAAQRFLHGVRTSKRDFQQLVDAHQFVRRKTVRITTMTPDRQIHTAGRCHHITRQMPRDMRSAAETRDDARACLRTLTTGELVGGLPLQDQIDGDWCRLAAEQPTTDQGCGEVERWIGQHPPRCWQRWVEGHRVAAGQRELAIRQLLSEALAEVGYPGGIALNRHHAGATGEQSGSQCTQPRTDLQHRAARVDTGLADQTRRRSFGQIVLLGLVGGRRAWGRVWHRLVDGWLIVALRQGVEQALGKMDMLRRASACRRVAYGQGG